MTLHKLHIVESPALTVRAFLRLQKSEMRTINTHYINTYHVGRASAATPDARITTKILNTPVGQYSSICYVTFYCCGHYDILLRSAPTSHCREPESNN